MNKDDELRKGIASSLWAICLGVLTAVAIFVDYVLGIVIKLQKIFPMEDINDPIVL